MEEFKKKLVIAVFILIIEMMSFGVVCAEVIQVNEDVLYKAMLEELTLIPDNALTEFSMEYSVKNYEVCMPSESWGFLHESAIIEYHGKMFAAWYNNHSGELTGETPIRCSVSIDEGKTWSEAETIVTDETGEILYCPPVLGICDNNLYLLLNQMVKADHIHSLDLYLYQEEKECFEKLWSRPIPFKLNTNIYQMENGSLIIGGRVAEELDGFPNTPAVLISEK